MLKLLREQGFAVIEADPDDGFPTLAGSLITADAAAETPVDLVWASSSLHHVCHPTRILSGVHRALAPDGVLVVVELATLPRFLSHPRGALLEQRSTPQQRPRVGTTTPTGRRLSRPPGSASPSPR
jgi:SAM-dependent methyltransferase